MGSGDACVALQEEEKRAQEQDAGDHKGPHPAQPIPRPYGYGGASPPDKHKEAKEIAQSTLE
jgi:hypothetical protein